MKKVFVTGVALLAACLSLWAQEPADSVSSLSLGLDEACKYAVEHNRSVQSASLAVRQSEMARWQAIASMLPQVSADLVYTNMCGYEMNMAGYSIAMNPYGNISVKAAIGLNGQSVVSALLAKVSVEMSEVSVAKTTQAIESNATTVYVSILATEQTLELLNRNVENLNELYAMQSKAVEVGAAEQVDADQIKVQVVSLKNSVNNVERQVEILYNSLRLLLGVGVDTEITLTQTLDDVVNPETIMALLGNDLTLADNYDYQLAEKQVQLAEKQKQLAAMAYTPTLSAYYQYAALTYFGQEEGFNMTPPNTVGVSLSVPIFSSGNRYAAVKEKRHALDAANLSLADTKDQLEVSDRQYRYNLSTSYEDYQVQKENMEVVQRVFDNIANKYKYGYSSSLDLTNASTNLISAQSSYVSSLTQMITAYVNLKNLLNK